MQDPRRPANLLFALVLCLFANCSSSQSKAGEGSAVLKGRIFDQEGLPVSKAKIVIENDNSLENYSGLSNNQGYFNVKYQACSSLSFCVIPPPKSRLCRAGFQHVDGETAKHFIVRLHKGFIVNGRITYKGTGLKGLDVDFYGSEGSAEDVHNGGHTTTHGNGEFNLLVTPGKKTVKITNNLYSNVPASYKQNYVITRDCHLAEIVIPEGALN